MATARSASIGRVEPFTEHHGQTHDGEPYARTAQADACDEYRRRRWRPSGSSATATCLIVTIDHPDSALNAVDARLHRELAELFRTLKQESTARAVVLTATGKAFSAGGDMAWFPELRTPEATHALRREGKQLIWDQLDVEVPIVCGLNGSAVGLGASVALLCDVIVMADDAKLIDPHVLVGLVAGDGGAAIWPLLLGPLAAKRHLMLGDPLTAAEAVRLGRGGRVVPGGRRGDPCAGLGRSPRRRCAVRGAGHQDRRQRPDQAGVADELRRVDGARDRVLLLERPRRGRRRVRRPPDARVRRAMTRMRSEGSDRMTMDAIEAIMTTRAIRRFSDEPVSDDDIATCLRAAQQAPSGGNVQPQQYVVLTEPEQKAAIGEWYRAAFDRYERSLPEPTEFRDEAQAESWRRTRDASRHLADHLAEQRP